MNRETIRTIIAEGQEDLQKVVLYERPFEFEPQGRYVLVGVRQAGKSYLLYQRAKQLLAEGHSVKELVYVNFDDERLLGMTADDLDLIVQAYGSMYEYQPVFFFDEIQNIEGWEHFARRLANKKYLVFITGSNAKMLSRDIATTLGARFFDEKVYPYSFREYLGAGGTDLDEGWEYGQKGNTVRRLFSEYFRWGGFPELMLYGNKRHWLNGLYEKIILGDVIQRHGIKNDYALRLVVKRLAENVKQPVSYNRLANMVKSTGANTTAASVIDYVTYVKEACLVFTLDNYASKFSERETVKKHYFTDNGLLNIFLCGDVTALLENLCAIFLHKKYNRDDNDHRLYYYNKNIEVDFFVPDEDYAVQVSYDMDDDSTRKREVSALVALNRLHPLKKAQIITYEEGSVIAADDLTIEVIPVWKWLLL